MVKWDNQLQKVIDGGRMREHYPRLIGGHVNADLATPLPDEMKQKQKQPPVRTRQDVAAEEWVKTPCPAADEAAMFWISQRFM